MKSNMKIKSLLGCILSVGLLSVSSMMFADDHHAASPSFKTSSVTKDITLLQGKGGNIAVLKGEQGLLMVDSDYKEMSEKLKTVLQSLGGEKQVAYIINTHWHGDHTGGNLDVNSSLKMPAVIIAHDNVRERLSTRQEVKLFKMVSEPYPEKALPSLTFNDELTLHFAGEKIELLHFPNGHTDGDAIVFFNNANVVHMGDHFFSGMFPFVDTGTGGNVLSMAANIKKVLAKIDDKTQVIPGHGPLSKKKDLQAFYEMLIGTSAEVKAMKDKKMSLEAMQKQGLSSKWDQWNNGFLKEGTWISIVNDSL